MSRFVFVGLMAAVLVSAATGDALAQRDAGAKARGEFGRGFWGPRQATGQYYAGPSFYQPMPAAESYRSFSYEPVLVSAGETVVVGPAEARVMLGRRQVGVLDAGQQFTVTRVVNGWLGAIVEQDGQELRGWVWHRNVEPQPTAAPVDQQGPAEAVPSPSYRRFSYEPAVVPALIPPVQTRRPAQRPAPPEVRLRPGTRRY